MLGGGICDSWIEEGNIYLFHINFSIRFSKFAVAPHHFTVLQANSKSGTRKFFISLAAQTNLDYIKKNQYILERYLDQT